MRLTDPWFEAEFYGQATETGYTRQGANIEGAQGLFLWCPCAYGQQYPAHGCLVPFANPRNAPPVPPNHGPFSESAKTHPRWTMAGTGLHDLTVTPSIDVKGGENKASCWHGFITAGDVR